MTTDAMRRALLAMQSDVEPLADFIARVTPNHAPIPPHLQRIVELGERTRQGPVYATISMPPRHGKTVTLAALLAWRVIYDPACLNFYATFGADLSGQTSRLVRRLAMAAGTQMSLDANQFDDWRTVLDGGLKATSVGGSVVGRGCNSGLIVADDLVKSRAEAESKLTRDRTWDWFRDDLMSRLQSGASLIVNATRYHEDDVIGRIQREPMGLEWEHIVLPAVSDDKGEPTDERNDPTARALWPSQFPLDKLAQVRMRGEHGWWSLYQQRPVPKGGRMFQRAWFAAVDVAPSTGRAVRGWDLAATKDGDGAATCGVKIRVVDGRYFVEDVKWLRGSPMEVEEAIVETARQDGHAVVQDIPQDPGQAGKAQKSYLASKLGGYVVKFSPETGSKEGRAEPFAAQAQAGNVMLVRANWNDAYLDEAESFPVGRLKDRIDASSRAFAGLIEARRPPQSIAGHAIVSGKSTASSVGILAGLGGRGGAR